MSVEMSDKRTNATRPWFHDRRDALDRAHDLASDRRHVTEMEREEEELAFVEKCVLTLAFLGITPLVLFLIICYLQIWFWSPE